MIEYAIMDYEGEPVMIEDGEMLDVFPDSGEHWNAETCEFEPDEDEEDEYPDDGKTMGDLYGRGWTDCNTDWRSWR